MTDQIGQALKAARQAAGLSVAVVARAALFSESHLRNVENGHRVPGRDIVTAYDDVIGAGGVLLDLFDMRYQEDDVKRRVLLGILGTVTGLGVAAPALVAETLRESLLVALGGDDWPDIAEEYGRRFMYEPPDLLQRRLEGDLLVLRHTLANAESAAVILVAPRLMAVHGMLSANLGDVDNAIRWYRAARLAADRTGDSHLRQWVRGREAFRRGYEGARPAEVLAITSDVDDIEAYLATAQAYARLSENRRAILSLNSARQSQDAAASADENYPSIYTMPEWRMALSSAYVYALMGDPVACDKELESVDPPSEVRRWESQLEMQRAVAHTRSGDIREGRDIATKALHATPKQERSIVLAEMHREAMTCTGRS
jgi:transcriptional regulator with XRE-family HTH domain